MNADEQSLRALDLFEALVDLAPAERETQLAALRAEAPGLAAEVQALLEADAREGLLERPPASLLAGVASPDDEPVALPERIGPWRITGVVGRGGMGAVYRGERDDGQFRQRAALKLIRLGMDTPELRARFVRERQILAALKHPNIATLLDGGVTDTGAPYFAMELVEGQPLDAWCDARRASLAERVRLFQQVCAAVQHAHQHLVVHRDIKPGNILVDAEGRVRLLDFGIAKLLAGDPDAPSATTRERPHTPDYAAPEQLRGGPITTAADVYALGVVLHLLLCGALPRPGEPLARAALAASDEQARLRGLDSKEALAARLRGDLSAIVLQCLQPEPAQRYASPGALAQDLRAWLEGTPVSARPPTRRYVLGKFVRRNRWGVAAVLALALALGGGGAGVLWQARKARAAAAESQAQLEYLRSLLQVLAPSTAEARELDRSRLITEAAAKARAELADKPASLASVEYALAQVAQDAGDYAQATQLADSAYALRARLFGEDSVPSAEALVLAGAVRMLTKPPQNELALEKLAAAIAVVRRRAPGSALLVDALQKRAAVLGELGRQAEHEQAIGEAAALCEGPLGADAACEGVWMEQGSVASRDRRYDQALQLLRRAYAARSKRLGEAHAETLSLASMLAWAQGEAGDLPGGIALAERVYTTYKRIYTQPTETSLRATMRLSRLNKRSGQSQRAVELIDEYLAACRKLFGDDHPDTILGYSDRASLLFGQGRFAEAAAQFAEASRAYRRGGSEINAALVQGFAGDALRNAGRAAEALPPQREAVAALKRLYPGGESLPLGNALVSLARTESELGHYPEALAAHDESVAMLRKLQSKGSTSAANARAFRGQTLLRAGRHAEAEAELRAALAELERARTESPNQYWEPFALLTAAACHQRAADCAQLREQARGAQKLSLAATTQAALRASLDAAP